MSWISEVGSFSITGNAGGAVTPVADNINIVGSGSIVVTGNPVLGTLTISGGGVSGMTQHALAVGTAGGSITSLTLGTNGTVLTGVTGADPAFSASPTLTTVYATTFDTNVAASAVTLSGTTLSADGTDVDININITAKGAGKVIIDDLQLTTDLAVTEGGTGASTLLDHGLLVGSGTAAVDALAVGATGVILTGVTGADPTWTSATYPSSVTKGDVLVASANNVIGVVNDVVNAGYVLTANAAAAPTFQVLPTPVVASFASDAETIAGAVTNKAVAPSNLAAKLGSQTLHALPIGAGSTAALNWLAVGANGETLMGSTGADCSWTNSPQFGGSVTATNDITSTAGNVVISSGNLTLPATTSTVGQIIQNGLTLWHRYGTNNIFIGDQAGNFTLTAQNSTCIGYQAGHLLTSPSNTTLYGSGAGASITSGANNCAFGQGSLAAASTSSNNAAFGHASLNSATGDSNCGFGFASLYTATSGSYNGAYGLYALGQLGSGSYNLALGYGGAANQGAGFAYTGTESSNICIHNAGTVGESNKIRIGTYGTGNGQQDTAYIAGVVHASNGLVSDAGNISATAGSVSANTTVTAGTDLVSTAGVLKLPTTSSTVGQIVQNNNTIFHTYGTDTANPNIFIGLNSGNFTNSGAVQNQGIGQGSLTALVGGAENFAMGYRTLEKLQGNAYSGFRNVALGNYAGYNLVGNSGTDYYGANNLYLGYAAGQYNNANERSNIYLNSPGVASENHTLRIGNGTSSTPGSFGLQAAYIGGIYGVTPGGTLNIALIDSNGQLGSTATLSPSLGGAMTWTEVTGTSQAAAVSNGYITNNVGLVTVTLPSTAAVGQRVAITGKGAGLWSLAQNSGQTVHFGSTDTTTGVGGSISATVRYDCIEVQCITANTDWVVIRSVGTLTIV